MVLCTSFPYPAFWLQHQIKWLSSITECDVRPLDLHVCRVKQQTARIYSMVSSEQSQNMRNAKKNSSDKLGPSNNEFWYRRKQTAAFVFSGLQRFSLLRLSSILFYSFLPLTAFDVRWRSSEARFIDQPGRAAYDDVNKLWPLKASIDSCRRLDCSSSERAR